MVQPKVLYSNVVNSSRIFYNVYVSHLIALTSILVPFFVGGDGSFWTMDQDLQSYLLERYGNQTLDMGLGNPDPLGRLSRPAQLGAFFRVH